MRFEYCPDCGEILHDKIIGDEGAVPFCEKCSRPWFPYSSPCVICLVRDEEGNVALIQQSYGDKRFVCVAGYVKAAETLEETVCREISEEIGLEVLHLRYVKSYYYPKRDNLMLGFVCTVKRAAFRLSGEVSEAQWFSVQEADTVLKDAAIARKLLHDGYEIE